MSDDDEDVVEAEIVDEGDESWPMMTSSPQRSSKKTRSSTPASCDELPEDPQHAVQSLLRTVAGLRLEAGSYLEDLHRVAADFDNYRKRVLREQAQNVDGQRSGWTRHLLPVLDSLDAALTDPDSPW